MSMKIVMDNEMLALIKKFRLFEDQKGDPEAYETAFKITEKLSAAMEPQETREKLMQTCETQLCPSCLTDWHETEGATGRCQVCQNKGEGGGCMYLCPCEKARRQFHIAARKL